jgi:hypothetical protein
VVVRTRLERLLTRSTDHGFLWERDRIAAEADIARQVERVERGYIGWPTNDGPDIRGRRNPTGRRGKVR